MPEDYSLISYKHYSCHDDRDRGINKLYRVQETVKLNYFVQAINVCSDYGIDF